MILIQSENIASSKNQDFIKTGITTDNKGSFTYLLLCDGHGHNIVINILKSLDYDTILSYDDPLEYIKKLISSIDSTGSGSTFSLVKIYNDYFHLKWIGDSKIVLLSKDINNISKIEFITQEHNSTSEIEMRRLDYLNKFLVKTPVVINNSTIRFINTYRFCFSANSQLMPSRALGHQNLTGSITDSIIFPRESNKIYKIINASDGLWDVINISSDLHMLIYNNASRLSQIAYHRWFKKWNVEEENSNGVNKVIRFTDTEADDIAIITCTC